MRTLTIALMVAAVSAEVTKDVGGAETVNKGSGRLDCSDGPVLEEQCRDGEEEEDGPVLEEQ